MRTIISFATATIFSSMLFAQAYPQPEFSNEVYLLKKGNPSTLVRLEKNYSKPETKTKLGGFGGVEYAYEIEGAKSTVRLNSDQNISFVFSTGAPSNSKSDSTLLANGIDPNALSATAFDPARMITLYKTSIDKSIRKVYLAKSSGAFSMGNKNTSSYKYSFSIKKIREGYWELVPDKRMPAGEYSFVVMEYSADGSYVLFAFGID